jgi:hypothetical protein
MFFSFLYHFQTTRKESSSCYRALQQTLCKLHAYENIKRFINLYLFLVSTFMDVCWWWIEGFQRVSQTNGPSYAYQRRMDSR